MSAQIQSNEYLRDYFGKLQGGADPSSLIEAILVFGVEHIRLNYVHSSSIAQQIITDARKVVQIYSKSKKEGDSIGLREELGSIKEELLKLNEKFETKLNTLSSNSDKGRISSDVKKVSVPTPSQIKTDPKRMQRSSSLSAVGTQKRRVIPQEATSTRAAALNQANHYEIFTQDQDKPFGMINPLIRQAKRTSVTPKVTEIVPKLEKPIRYAPKIPQQSDVQIKALMKEDSILLYDQNDDSCQVNDIPRKQQTKLQKNTHLYGQANQGKLQQQQQQIQGQRKKRAQSNYESQQKQQQEFSQHQESNYYQSKQNQSSRQTLSQEQELQYDKQQKQYHQQQQKDEQEGQFAQYASDEKTLMGNISPKFNEAISATQRLKSNESQQHRPPTHKGSSHNNTAVYYDPRKMGKGQLFGKHNQSNQYKHVESKIKGQLQHHRSMSRNSSDNSSINNRTNLSQNPYQSQYYQASQDRSLSQQQQYPYQGESAQESQVIEDSAQLEDRPRQQISSNNYSNNSFNRQSRMLSSQQYQQQSQSLNQTQNQNIPPQDVFSLGRIPQNEEYNRYSSQPASTYQEELEEQENIQINNYDSLNVRASQDTHNQYLIDSYDRDNNAQYSHKNYQDDISRNSHITDHSYIDINNNNNNNNTSGLSATGVPPSKQQQYISRPTQNLSYNASNVRGSGSSVLVSQSGLMNTSGNLVSTSHLNPFKTGHLNISNNYINQQHSVNYDNYNSNVERQPLGHLLDNPNRKNIKQQGSENKAQFNSTQRSKMTTELSPYGQDSTNRKNFNTNSPDQTSSQRALYQLSERQSSQRQLESQDQQLSTEYQQDKQSLNNTTGNISNSKNNNNRHSSAKQIPKQQYQQRQQQQQYSQQQQLSSQQLLHNASNSPFKFQETFTNRQDIACEYSDSERNQRSQNTNHLSPSPPNRNSQQSMEGEFSPLDIPEENKKVFQNDTLFMKKSFQHSFSRPVTNRSDYL